MFKAGRKAVCLYRRNFFAALFARFLCFGNKGRFSYCPQQGEWMRFCRRRFTRRCTGTGNFLFVGFYNTEVFCRKNAGRRFLPSFGFDAFNIYIPNDVAVGVLIGFGSFGFGCKIKNNMGAFPYERQGGRLRRILCRIYIGAYLCAYIYG